MASLSDVTVWPPLVGISIIGFWRGPQRRSDRHRMQLSAGFPLLRVSTNHAGGQLVAQSFASQKLCGSSSIPNPRTTITLGWTRQESNIAPYQSIMFIRRNRIADNPTAHGRNGVPLLPANQKIAGIAEGVGIQFVYGSSALSTNSWLASPHPGGNGASATSNGV